MSVYRDYGKTTTSTPQSQPIPGREAEMVRNNAGGYGFKLDDWERLHRFLIIGSEGGTYYVGQSTLTEQNAQVAIRCIKQDGPRAVQLAHDINVDNLAPKTDQQLFLLALAMKHGDLATKQAVHTLAPGMLRTGTHLLHLVAMLDGLGGWNRSKRRLIANWFEAMPPDRLAYQVLKYRNRDGWTMRDVLRVAHPGTPGEPHRAIYDWLCDRRGDHRGSVPDILAAHSLMTLATAGGSTPVAQALWGISHGIPREALPTEALADREVWRALLPQTPPHALLRNLGSLTAKGLSGPDALLIRNKLTDAQALRKARVHPFAVLLATLIYKSGHGIRGSQTWTPDAVVLGALEDAYDLSFEAVEPTGKQILIGIDISGSMAGATQGTPVRCSTAAAAMAITLARLEPRAIVCRFDTDVVDVPMVTKRTSIAQLEDMRGGGTDLTAPIRWATRNLHTTSPIDAFIILTDSETWAGSRHPVQALDAYRKAFNPKAKLICASMAANHANVVDPQDPLQLGAAGLDASLPSIVAEFIKN